MSKQQNKPGAIPNKLVDLFVSDILQKNGISKQAIKGKITAEKKQAIMELVEDLSKQVDAFVNKNTASK
ncbi:spore coat protein [Mesobacillus stamsii]|uniref:Spore coat protein W n=1 Tax=Mesobacillus stamsii TaxID=225347 RepID=A0ABU0FQE0_9BACI|nr:spore coat protein [Mesobacillus stamsii]MDQ0411866.1 spore coat protein W [Mesobacillus stamsii]